MSQMTNTFAELGGSLPKMQTSSDQICKQQKMSQVLHLPPTCKRLLFWVSNFPYQLELSENLCRGSSPAAADELSLGPTDVSLEWKKPGT